MRVAFQGVEGHAGRNTELGLVPGTRTDLWVGVAMDTEGIKTTIALEPTKMELRQIDQVSLANNCEGFHPQVEENPRTPWTPRASWLSPNGLYDPYCVPVLWWEHSDKAVGKISPSFFDCRWVLSTWLTSGYLTSTVGARPTLGWLLGSQLALSWVEGSWEEFLDSQRLTSNPGVWDFGIFFFGWKGRTLNRSEDEPLSNFLPSHHMFVIGQACRWTQFESFGRWSPVTPPSNSRTPNWDSRGGLTPTTYPPTSRSYSKSNQFLPSQCLLGQRPWLLYHHSISWL